MPATYRIVNYALRPAKFVERKMIVEALRRLEKLAALKHYRYVGFGSIYFSDFSLFHRELGIGSMVSIERDVKYRDRFEFNRPFASIELRFGEASTVLPSLDWTQRTITWLDYDGKLTVDMLADVETVVSQTASASMLLVTVNAEPDTPIRDRVEKLRERLGRNNVPPDAGNEDLGEWGTAAICQQIIDDRIQSVLRDRNGPLPHGSQLIYDQLFNFQYQDSTKMLTVGGLFYDEGQRANVLGCNFDDVHCVRRREDAYTLSIPNLTVREIRHLDSQLPTTNASAVRSPGLLEREVQAYVDAYRYFPSFVYAES
jgi:hypothetical protein